MNVLFIGDIVGPLAVDYVIRRLPELRARHSVDLVIANAENCHVSGRIPSSGFGMDQLSIERLLSSGVDVITSGNHAWDAPNSENILSHPRVIRPFNVPSRYPGKGIVTATIAGEVVTVINVADQSSIPDSLPAYPAWPQTDVKGTIIVDFHGGDVMQKLGFAHAMDGRVAAVLGTHTHEPTQTLHLLPGGTALVIDVGMTGPTTGWQGIDPAHLIAWYREEDATELAPFELAKGPIELGSVLLKVEGGRTADIRRVH